MVLLRLAAATLALQSAAPPPTLPAFAARSLHEKLAAAAPHATHVWRDTVPLTSADRVNGYIEIPRGERRKFELNIATLERFVDRVMPRSLGAYPVNYGFVPQTVSYDGDPFDVLILGPPLRGGDVYEGIAVGVLHMEDEKGLDSKVVTSRVDASGRPLHTLTDIDRRRIGDYFSRYKQHEPGKYSRVGGWGSAGEGLAFVRQTHAFFLGCRAASGDCVPAR
jgi:inorganic pyrophosphatase